MKNEKWFNFLGCQSGDSVNFTTVCRSGKRVEENLCNVLCVTILCFWHIICSRCSRVDAEAALPLDRTAVHVHRWRTGCDADHRAGCSSGSEFVPSRSTDMCRRVDRAGSRRVRTRGDTGSRNAGVRRGCTLQRSRQRGARREAVRLPAIALPAFETSPRSTRPVHPNGVTAAANG